MTTLKCPRPSLLFSYYIILITSVLYLLLLYFIQHDSAPGYWEVWRSLCSNTTSPCNMGNPISGRTLFPNTLVLYHQYFFPTPRETLLHNNLPKGTGGGGGGDDCANCGQVCTNWKPVQKKSSLYFLFPRWKIGAKKYNLLVNMHPQGIIVVPGSSSFANAIKASVLLLLIAASLQVNM